MLFAWIKKIKLLLRRFINWLRPRQQKPGGLLGEIEDARANWRWALVIFDNADSELIDYAIYNLNACERRFMGLLKQAREQGLKAWSPEQMEKIRSAVPGEG